MEEKGLKKQGQEPLAEEKQADDGHWRKLSMTR
jgi:hypothetical protein